jgi:putative ABC transport system permease protein
MRFSLHRGAFERSAAGEMASRKTLRLDWLWQDLKYGARGLRKSPAFTVAAVIALALGIGANTAIYSVVHTVLFRPLPYPDPGRLVMVWETRGDIDPARFPNPKSAAALVNRWTPSNSVLARWQERNRSFERMAGFNTWVADLTGNGEPERSTGLTVTPDFFALVGARPTIGRTFLPQEDSAGNDEVIVLGHGLWQRRFGSDPAVLGSKVLVDGAPHTVIGVMPAGFQAVLPEVSVRRPDFFLPSWHQTTLNRRFTLSRVAARLKPGVSMGQAQAEMSALADALQQEFPRQHKGHGVRLSPLAREVSGEARPAMLVLFGAVGCVLLICCANVTNLLLARAGARQREIGMRAALGAGRGRLLRQMLTESILLGALGGAAGVLLAAAGVRLLVAAIPAGTIPRMEEIQVDAGVLAFGAGLSLVTAILFGLAPALQAARWSARGGLADVLKEGGGSHGRTGHSRRVRSLLVVSEMAVALVLLSGAGLLVRSFIQLRSVDLGFRAENVLAVSMKVTDARYADKRRVAEFSDRVLERVRAIPEVQAAAITNSIPMAADINISVSGIELEGRPGVEVSSSYRTVTPDYFRVMAIPLRKGRGFTSADARGGVAVVNEAFVRRYLPDVRDDSPEPLGRHLKWNRLNASIIGVVADVKSGGPRSEAGPEVFLPHTEAMGQGLGLVVRTGANAAALAPLIRAAIREINPNQPLGRIATMEQIISDSVAQPRFHMLLLAAFAGLAVALAAVGIYGVMTYSVAQRTREIGVRMALGAERGTVLRMILGQALGLILAGVGIGLAAAAASTRVLSKFLFGVKPIDAATFAAVSLLLAAVALVASWVPARRAMRVDPTVALRCE